MKKILMLLISFYIFSITLHADNAKVNSNLSNVTSSKEDLTLKNIN